MTAVEVQGTLLPPVGERFTRRMQLRVLPIGSQIRGARTGNVLTKVTDEAFITASLGSVAASGNRGFVGDRKQINGMPANAYYLHTLPGEADAPPVANGAMPDDVADQSPITWGTVTQFKARFFTSIWGSARRASIYEHAVTDAFRELGLERDLTLGMPVNMWDRETLNALPVGATVVFGVSGSEASVVYGKQRHAGVGREDWAQLINRNSAHIHDIGFLDQAAGIERKAWVDEVGTDEDLTAIHDFKRRAHAVGQRARDHAGWCSEYQVSMRRAGVPDRLPPGRLRLLDPDAVSVLDEGTVLRVPESSTPVFYVRDNRAGNPCRTVRLGGATTGHWFPHLMLAATPSEPLAVSVLSAEEMQAMPIGTVARVRGGRDSQAWRKRAVDTWTSFEGYAYTYTAADLTSGTADLTYSYIPRETTNA